MDDTEAGSGPVLTLFIAGGTPSSMQAKAQLQAWIDRRHGTMTGPTGRHVEGVLGGSARPVGQVSRDDASADDEPYVRHQDQGRDQDQHQERLYRGRS